MTYSVLVPDHNFSKEAETISAWTFKAKTMLPKSTKEIKQFVNEGRSVFVWDQNLGLVAHAAITFFWSLNWAELGAVVVDPEQRGKGWGTIAVIALLGLVKEKFPDKKPFALCNIYSLGIFMRAGGQIIKDPNLLPNEVWKECNNCPNFQKAKSEGRLCCDTPVLLNSNK